MFNSIGEALAMLGRATRSVRLARMDRHRIATQIVELGNASLLMVSVMALFIGGVMTLQAGPELSKRGLGDTLGAIVGVGMVKELGPVMIAILIAGRVGSAMAAELAAMRVYQEVDALETMNIDPVRFLVMPRLLAMFFVLPCLTLIGDVVGWAGAAFVAQVNGQIDVPWERFFRFLMDSVEFGDVMHGVYKSVAFAILITTTCCYVGLRTRGGPREIGQSVTIAVVSSIVLILVFDYVITRILL